MTDNIRHDPDDRLDHSIAALRNTPIPAGPNAQTIAATLAALRRAASGNFVAPDPTPVSSLSSVVTLFRSLKITVYRHRKASAISVALSLAIVCAFSLFGGGNSVSLAQVAERLRSVRSVTSTARTTIPGQNEPIILKVEQLGRRTRSEMPGGVITITDQDFGEILLVNPILKTATLTKMDTLAKVELLMGPQQQPAMPFDPIRDLRRLADQQGKSVGEQRIGNVKAKGIRSTLDGREITVWIDPDTKLPLRIETVVETAGQKTRVTLDEFAFDVPLDEKRFSLDAPPGFMPTQ